MIIPHPSVSYPYLAVAQKHGVPYGEVLILADKLDDPHYQVSATDAMTIWVYDTVEAWVIERERRHCGLGS